MATVLERIVQPKSKKPEAGTINWFNECVREGQRDEFFTKTLVTPGLAAELLKRNADNRPVSDLKVQHYAADMRAGRWSLNGEAIKVSKDGLLNDGQHRLLALIESNTPTVLHFGFGFDRSTRTTLDQGRARTASDYLAMDGFHYATGSAVAARLIIAFERSNGDSISERRYVTNAEVTERVRRDPKITESAAFAQKDFRSYRGLVAHSIMAACHYILSEIDENDANEYLAQVASGEGIRKGDPAYAVRQAFLTARERADSMAIIFNGWNAYRQGRKLSIARPTKNLPALI